MISLLVVVVPLLLAGGLLLVRSDGAARLLALIGAAAVFLGAVVLQGSAAITLPWIPGIGAYLAFDPAGAGGVLAFVASLVMVPTVLWATVRVLVRQRTFLAALFAFWGCLLGLFLARDLVLFYVFWELTLIPSLAMLGGWGGPNRRPALLKYLIYAVAGSFAMLLSVLAIRPLSGAPSFLFADLLASTAALETLTQTWIFAGFVLAFAVKLPIFPVHHWLVDFHEQNHASGAADAAGTLYKVGGFGLFAWALPLLPAGAATLGPWLLVVAAFSAAYAAVVAVQQTNLKRLLAYASLSHMGLVAVGVLSLHLGGLAGGMYLLAAQMVTTGGLFLLSGMLHARRHTFDLGAYGGLAASAPGLAAVTLLVLLAAIGVPGLANFPGEFLALAGTFMVSPAAAALGLLAVIAAGVYGVNLYARLFQGRAEASVAELGPLEIAVLVPIVVATLWLGLHPAPALAAFRSDAAVTVTQQQLVVTDAPAPSTPAPSAPAPSAASAEGSAR